MKNRKGLESASSAAPSLSRPVEQKSERTGRIPVVILIGQLGSGGSERQLYYLLKYRNQRIFDYRVIVMNSSLGATYESAILDLGVEVWRMPESCTGKLPRMHRMYRLLRRIKPMIIHSWSFHQNPYVALAGYLTNVPVRLGSQRITADAPDQARLHPVHRWLAYRSVSGLIVNSKMAARETKTLCGLAQNVHLVHNGVELPDISLPPDVDLSSFGIEPGHSVVGTVGNLRTRKNHRMFVDSMADVLSRFPDVRCVIVGKAIPEERYLPEQLKAHIESLGLSDKIKLTGQRSDVPQLMRRMSVFCFTSISEGLPNVVLEAMAAACPVVATRVGGVPDIIKDGENGFLVEKGDKKGMERIVTMLLEDIALSLRIGLAGRRTVEQHLGCQQMACNMERVYSRALIAKCTMAQEYWLG